MYDVNAFERQVADEALHMAGPSEPVDDAAIFTSITATQSPKWRFQSMFSATKYVVAGVVLALFGGFLLSGVLTQQPSDEQPPAVGASASATTQAEPTDAATSEPEPTTGVEADFSTSTSDLLPGVDLVTEEIEPGVYRVLNDGVRDLHAPPPRSGTRNHLNALTPEAMAIGQDGHPWLVRESRLLRLGETGEQAFEAPGWAPEWLNMAVDASGTFWGHQDPELSDVYGLESFDGSTWTRHDWPDGSEPESFRIEAAPDGSVIVGSGDRVARIRNGEWSFLPSWEGVTRGQVYYSGPVATDDAVWLGCGRHIRTWEAGCEGLLRFDGTAWDVVAPMPERPDLYAGPLAVGPDGTLWAYLNDPDDADDRFLARLRDDRWSVFSAEDGVPPLMSEWEYGSDLSVDGEGTLWIATELRSWDDAMGPAPGPLSFPNGVLSFDGTTWRQYLADMNVQQIEAVDGYVWALDGAEHRGDGLHVITPEAVAAADAVAIGEAAPVDTATTPDLLPGVDLVAEEVEPGVYRVLSDGVRDLTEERTARIVYGQDGSVWLFRDKRLFRLGDADTHEWPNEKKKDASDPRNADDIEVGPDGVVWWADPGGRGLWSFDGQSWTLRREKPSGEDSKVDEVEVLPDGTVLASWRSNRSRKVARLDADGWEVFKTIDVTPNNRAILDANDAGDVWLQLSSQGPDIDHLYRGRYDEGSEVVLRRVKLPPESIFSVRLLDGTVWADARGPILNFDGEIWTEDAYPGGHPEGGWPGESTPDGQLWYDSSCEVDMNALDNGDAYLHGCELVHFDGQDASRFELDDTYGYSKVVAPDGTLWLVLDAEQGGGLYVITPEAVAE